MKMQLVEEIRKELKKKVGEKVIITIATVHKNNGVKLLGVTIREEGQSVSPTVYIDRQLEDMKNGLTVAEEVAEDIIRITKENSKCGFDNISALFSKAFILENVEYQIINAGKNADRLEGIPHKEFLDLAITYRVCIENADGERGTVLVSDGIMSTYDISLEELDEVAEKNTAKNGFRLLSMTQVLDGMNEMPEEMISSINEPPMYVLTNTQKVYGAAGMLYIDLYRGLAEKHGGDLYVIPSSVHEVLIFPVEIMDKECVENMICYVNEQEVSEEEFLSNSLYIYRKESDVLEIA